jgi:hypothetical protein
VVDFTVTPGSGGLVVAKRVARPPGHRRQTRGIIGAVTETTIQEITTPLTTDEGDHEKFAHYVAKDKVVESAVTGTPLVALCGKVWVPSRDPSKFPVCPECKEIYESLPKGG